jgi:hypothetical protein
MHALQNITQLKGEDVQEIIYYKTKINCTINGN